MADVLIDPGHSESEPGARGKNPSVQEENLNRFQAEVLKKELAALGVSADIHDPLTDDLHAIGMQAKDYKAFISLHLNAYSGKEHYTCAMCNKNRQTPSSASAKLASEWAQATAKAIGNKIFGGTEGWPVGVMAAGLGVLSGAADSGVPLFFLSELEFVDDETEEGPIKARIEKGIKAGAAVLAHAVKALSPVKTSSPSQTLKHGARGEEVKKMQTQLNLLGYACGVADGIWGDKTEAAVRAFQRDTFGAAEVDGLVGPRTRAALFAAKPVAGKMVAVPYFWQEANTNEPGRTCNLTSLAMVMRYWGKNVTPDELYSKAGGPVFTGSGVASVAKSYGLKAVYSEKGSAQEIKKHLDRGVPVILQGWFTESGHFIVIVGYDKTGWICNDPEGRWSQAFKGGYSAVNGSAGEGVRYGYKAVEESACDPGNPSSYWITTVEK
jgi:hypothetical protein